MTDRYIDEILYRGEFGDSDTTPLERFLKIIQDIHDQNKARFLGIHIEFEVCGYDRDEVDVVITGRREATKEELEFGKRMAENRKKRVINRLTREAEAMGFKLEPKKGDRP